LGKRFGTNHPGTRTVLLGLSEIFARKRFFAPVMTSFQRARPIREALFGNEHPATSELYKLIGEMFYLEGDYEGALGQFEKALKIYESVFGTTSLYAADVYHDIRLVAFAQGDFDRALKEYRKTLVVKEAITGRDHQQLIPLRKDIARALRKKGHICQGIALLCCFQFFGYKMGWRTASLVLMKIR
jgi:tetratricopeptide (TPR) repeat protein